MRIWHMWWWVAAVVDDNWQSCWINWKKKWMNKRMAIERRPSINICMCMYVYVRRFYHMHTRTRSIYNRSRSADLCVCASHIVSFQKVHIYKKKENREYQRETRQKTLSNIHVTKKSLSFTRLPWLINYERMEREKKFRGKV